MKARLALITLLISIFSVLPAFAQENCPDIFKDKLKNISGIKAVVQDQNGFLAILDGTSKSKAANIVSRIKKLRKKSSANQCDFSGVNVAVMDSSFKQVKSSTDDTLKKANVSDLLYKYVYKLSPVEVEENLAGYQKLAELSPDNSYYAARIEHYTKRANLHKTRADFITNCLRELKEDDSVLDLKIKKDFYLFVVAEGNPLKTATDFLNKVAEISPRPDKKICIIAYSKDLSNKKSSCPAEYRDQLDNTEEELLMRHVQSIPGFDVRSNINGYKALKELNPNSTLYTKKLAAYTAKGQGLNRFLNLKTASGKKLITKESSKGATLFATLNSNALSNRSDSANHKLLMTIAAYYERTEVPYDKCVLKDSAGNTLGTISCSNSGCSLK